MNTFIIKENTAYVAAYAVDIYLPFDYLDKAYRGTKYYEIAGTRVRYFGLGNMRFYDNEKELENPSAKKVYTLGIPMIITSIPSDIDTKMVLFQKGGIERKCIVLRLYRDDVFIENLNLIKSNNNVMIYLLRIESGKLNHITPDEAASILHDVQDMNGIKLRIPSEEEEMMIAERFRNPNKNLEKARFSDVDDPDKLTTLSMRQESMASTTYQAVTGEDINNALISSINSDNAGEVDEMTTMEKIVLGKDVSDLVEERDEQLAAEATEAPAK